MSGVAPSDARPPPDDTLAQKQVEERKSAADLAAAVVRRIGHDDEARRWIATTIIRIFAASVAIVLGMLVAQGIWGRAGIRLRASQRT
jgi:hypothetical protein